MGTLSDLKVITLDKLGPPVLTPELPLVIPETPAHNGEIKGKVKSTPPRSLGRPEFDKSSLIEFQSQPPEKQKEVLKTEWADAAFVLVERAKRFAMTVSKRDFGKLQQLTTTAGIAYDKIFPKGDANQGIAVHGNVMFNLFGNLGADKIQRILTPQVAPILEEHKNGTALTGPARSTAGGSY